MPIDNSVRLSKLETEVAVLRTELRVAINKLDDVAERQDQLREQASRWKGAFAIVLGMGGFIGLVSSLLKDWLSQ